MTNIRLAALGLTFSVIAGCATTETVVIQPECDVPGQPTLPAISSDRLAGLDDTTFWDLMERERRLVDWAMDMQAMLGVLCGGDDGD